PLGGYVKISGMIDESMDKEQMAQPPQPWEFRSKPTWQRLIIMLGGVTVNFILALIIYIGASYAYGDTDISAASIKDGYLIENPLLTDLGFKTGDDIVKVGEVNIVNESDIRTNIIGAKTVTIKRDNAEQSITLPEDFLGQLSTRKGRRLFEIRTPFMVVEVPDSSFNKGVDLQKGDLLVSINGKEVKYRDEVPAILNELKGETVAMDFMRNNQR